MSGLAECATLGELGHAGADFVGADVGRVERATVPLEHGFAGRMSWLGHGVEELFEAREAANILGRRATFAINEPGVVDGRIGGEDALDRDAMPPVVAKIVDIDEGGDAAFDELGKTLPVERDWFPV